MISELGVDRPADGVLELTLRRPEARNALGPDLIVALADALAEFAADDAVRVAILTGADPAFCAGMDVKAFGSGSVDRSIVGDTIRAVATGPKPVIAAVNGAAVAGGLELALACDWIVASDRALFADAHATVRAFPGGGLTVTLPRAVGAANARAMMLGGLRLDADAAVARGLAARAVPHEELLPAAREMAARVAGADPALVAAFRVAVADHLDIGRDEAFAREDERRRAWRAAQSSNDLISPPPRS